MQKSKPKIRFGLTEETLSKIIGILKQHPEVDSAVLYGSRAKGNYRNGSDIDLTLMGTNLTHRSMLRIDDEIDDLLLPYSFDISVFSQIDNLDLIEHIHRCGIALYTRQQKQLADS